MLLENYSVLELSQKELLSIDGGIVPLVIAIGACMFALGVATVLLLV